MKMSRNIAKEEENELLFIRFRRKMSANIRTFGMEVYNNIVCLRAFLNTSLAWLASCMFSCQCYFQQCIEAMENYSKQYTGYNFPMSLPMKVFCSLYSFGKPRKETTTQCICKNEIERFGDFKYRYVKYKLRGIGIVNRDDPNNLQDARTLIFVAQTLDLDKLNINKEWLESPKSTVKDWTLAVKVIQQTFPILFHEKPYLFNCISTSGTLSQHHIVEIIFQLFSLTRFRWRHTACQLVINMARVIERFWKPCLEVSGKGIKVASLNHFNEINVKSVYQCPRFSVRVWNETGETWKESSKNAINWTSFSNREGIYGGATSSERDVNCSPLLQIHRLSNTHYKICYKPTEKLPHEISIFAGDNKAYHVYGSPVRVTVLSYEKVNGDMEGRKVRPRRKSSYLENRNQALSIASGLKVAQEDTIDEESGVKPNNDDGLLTSWMHKLTHYATAMVASVATLVVKKEAPKDIGKKFSVGRKFSVNDKIFLHRRNESLLGLSSLSVGQSRELHIKRVTVIKYLNQAMPTLNEYFFGDKFQENFESGSTADGTEPKRRWSNISVLLRQKVRKESFPTIVEKTMAENHRKKSLAKRRNSNRVSRDDHDGSWHDKYRNIKNQQEVKVVSSSSSDNGNDSTDVSPELQRKNDVNTINSTTSPRFDNIFKNQHNTADYFLASAISGETSIKSNLITRKHLLSKRLPKRRDLLLGEKVTKVLEHFVNDAIKHGIKMYLKELNNNQK